MLPSVLATQLKKGLRDYIATSYPMTNEPFKGSLQHMLDQENMVFHDPFVSVRLPFRVDSTATQNFEAIHTNYAPYVHQQKAFARLTGDDGSSTIIATGTGSGKTECFLYPILEYCYQHRKERGIKALIIYPMNALASDQAKRIANLIYNSPELRGNVTAGMYVGGGRDFRATRMMDENRVITDHDTLLHNPPDILLTNYKMLDYLLVRPKDATLWSENRPDTLKYIAVDELHTFDGAQGTDLACLLRRLKARLFIRDGYLCCIGTSATMGSQDSGRDILQYATEVFGERFEDDAIVTEERLSPQEFFANCEVTDFTAPIDEDVAQLVVYRDQDDEAGYLQVAVKAWLDLPNVAIMTDEGRLALAKQLKQHSFTRDMLTVMQGGYCQLPQLIDTLKTDYPQIANLQDPIEAINALLALISHARTGTVGHLRPFLFVHVQLWIRELRRLLASINLDKQGHMQYVLASDPHPTHNIDSQPQRYLPVVNCRDCGATAWAYLQSKEMNAVNKFDLTTFYTQYFKADSQIILMYPYKEEDIDSQNPINNFRERTLCPQCLTFTDNNVKYCEQCNVPTIKVLWGTPATFEPTGQFSCPFCDSNRGLSLIGFRSATETSSCISQLFASKFNDDKKTLTFSDNVQDAAHRAGFFNNRTWQFGLHCAIERYILDGGEGKTLTDFCESFYDYWSKKLDRESFVGSFIAPNMTWKYAYKDMLKNRKLSYSSNVQLLLQDIKKRLAYEIMLEFGLRSHAGNTLERTGCACLTCHYEELAPVAESVLYRVRSELKIFATTETDVVMQMIAGFIDIMRKNGAFNDGVFNSFIQRYGKSYLLTNDHIPWLPGKNAINIPRFLAQKDGGNKIYAFDELYTQSYVDWIGKFVTEMADKSVCVATGKIILEELVNVGLVVNMPTDNKNLQVYGLNKDRMYITSKVVRYRCNTCGSVHFFADAPDRLMLHVPCKVKSCPGRLEESPSKELNYYGKLYSQGDIARVNAKEHTGLLSRPNREKVELDFKRPKDDYKPWDTNVLSCTPTLEMGIDIGDLSSVLLCSVPPAQAQFLQRIGRAGRKDGNALSVTVANAQAHDLYFYEQPLEMIQGEVHTPHIFLQASAVLERQFVAFCMDSWVKKGPDSAFIPKTIGDILNKIDGNGVENAENVFPYNFLQYVQKNLRHLQDTFIQLFKNIEDYTVQDIKNFAQGDGLGHSPMYIRILDAFADLKKHRESIRKNLNQAKEMIKDLQALTKDSSRERDIKEIKSESISLVKLIREINKKDVFNFLSDEGLLPNYAFPETGVTLKAILLHNEKKDNDAPQNDAKASSSSTPAKKKPAVYEYNRSAALAIREFAPNNTFYVDGHKLKINQIDVNSSQYTKWRFCPKCSYAEMEETSKHVSACPKCGSLEWADGGQVRSMRKIQMVYSVADEQDSQIDDAKDDRTVTMYRRNLLVTVDESKDVKLAYRMDNERFAFGYEFVSKATMRDINYGENSTQGQSVVIAGHKESCSGFTICKYCGMIQKENISNKVKGDHARFCKISQCSGMIGYNNEDQLYYNDTPITHDYFEESLFLYREFTTEALRILIPATSLDITEEWTNSFRAAFMLGMKEYFGNVDHLRDTITEEPVADTTVYKKYLVIYDSVPGGTGYLKQLMNDHNSFVDILTKALEKLKSCSCGKDEKKDGCYHCLYAYRFSGNMDSVSRRKAIELLEQILKGKNNLQKIDKLANVPVNNLFDSELERYFIQILNTMKFDGKAVKLTDKELQNGKHGYALTVNGSTWEIEPQVELGMADNVAVNCKPDFIFWPLNAENKLPVAVFTDGFAFHKDIVDDDTLKREAIRRSGKFRVWSISWNDVKAEDKSVSIPEYCTNTLNYKKMPLATSNVKAADSIYIHLTQSVSSIPLAQDKPMQLLVAYLALPDGEKTFIAYARALSYALLTSSRPQAKASFPAFNAMTKQVNTQVSFFKEELTADHMISMWKPYASNYSHLVIYAGLQSQYLREVSEHFATVCAVLEDQVTERNQNYEAEWNGFFHFMNVMQFAENFIAVSQKGITDSLYYKLPTELSDTEYYIRNENDDVYEAQEHAWEEVKQQLFEEEILVADACIEAGVEAPDLVGQDLDANGEVIGTIIMGWSAQKVCYMTADQFTNKAQVQAQGWTMCQDIPELLATLKGV